MRAVVPCELEACKKELAEWKRDYDGNDGDSDYESRHCEARGCHHIAQGRNGWKCETCGIFVCENSCGRDLDELSEYGLEDSDQIYCPECRLEILSQEKLRLQQGVKIIDNLLAELVERRLQQGVKIVDDLLAELVQETTQGADKTTSGQAIPG